jgi:glycosyltransferase involved in cell wall biosynthesis
LRGKSLLFVLFLVLDLFCLNAAYAAVFYLRYREFFTAYFLQHTAVHYVSLILVTNVLYLGAARLFRTYRLPQRFRVPDIISGQARVLAVTAIGSIVVIFLTRGLALGDRQFQFSRPTLLFFWLAGFLLTVGGRSLFGRFQEALFARGLLTRRLLIVGTRAAARDLLERLERNPWFGARVVGIATPDGDEAPGVADPAGAAARSAAGPATTTFATLEDLERALVENAVDEAFVALRPESTKTLLGLLTICRDRRIALRMLPEHFQVTASHFMVSEIAFLEGAHRFDILFDLYGRVSRDLALERARVAVVGSKGIPASFGGIERHVAELTSCLVDRGFSVRVYCRPYYSSIGGSYHGVELVTLPTIYTKHLDAITHTLLSTIHAVFSGMDIVHYHAMGPSVLSFIPRMFGMKTVVTVHGLDWKREKWGALASRFLRFGEFASARFPNQTIVISRVLERYYLERHGRPVACIPNGLALRAPLAPRRISGLYGLRERDYVLFVGRLVPEKGCHTLLEAFRRVATDKRLVVVGGTSHSDEYVERLHAMGREDARVLFAGYLYGDVLTELFSNSYAYVHPSSLEGLSLALLEALSLGSAVLASDIPENAEVLLDTGDAPRGLTFRSGDAGDLREKLQLLLDRPEEADRLRERGHAFVVERYNWNRVADQTAQLYEEILRG